VAATQSRVAGRLVSNVVRHPSAAACETCSQGIAVMLCDSVLLCAECCEILGVPPFVRAPAPPVTPVRVAPKQRNGDRLAEILNAILKDHDQRGDCK
jgi:hypothetical protein